VPLCRRQQGTYPCIIQRLFGRTTDAQCDALQQPPPDDALFALKLKAGALCYGQAYHAYTLRC
jgi:hypothetical protein